MREFQLFCMFWWGALRKRRWDWTVCASLLRLGLQFFIFFWTETTYCLVVEKAYRHKDPPTDCRKPSTLENSSE